MNKESKFNTDRNTGSFSRPVHHGEVVRNATVRNDAPSALNQNLAASDGISFAKRAFARRKNS